MCTASLYHRIRNPELSGETITVGNFAYSQLLDRRTPATAKSKQALRRLHSSAPRRRSLDHHTLVTRHVDVIVP